MKTTQSWAERIQSADADAERQWNDALEECASGDSTDATVEALLAIAAELRAQRVAQRPANVEPMK